MKGLVLLLKFLNENWTFIIIALGLGILLYKKIKKWLTLSTEDKIAAALHAVKTTILDKMTDQQIDWYGIKGAGGVKRAKVIAAIYNDYPILKEYINQEELLEKIDDIIDDALEEVKEIADNCINNSNVLPPMTTDSSIETVVEGSNEVVEAEIVNDDKETEEVEIVGETEEGEEDED